MTFLELFDEKYGPGHISMLYLVGGNPNPIIERCQSLIGELDAFGVLITEEMAVQALYDSIHKATEQAYFSKISRQAAQAIYDTLQIAPQSTLHIWGGFTYNYLTFACTWGAVHPEEKVLDYNFIYT